MATAVSPITIHDPDDARLSEYRNLTDHDLRAQHETFIAEGERVVRRLLASSFVTRSVLVNQAKLGALQDALCGPCPVYVAPQRVLNQIVGFKFHRGCLAVGARPTMAADDWATILQRPCPRLMILENVTGLDNLGTLIRNAAAFGLDAAILSPHCADPFYRKVIRVSMGTVFTLPIFRLDDWPAGLAVLKAQANLPFVGTVVDSGARPLYKFPVPERFGVLFGAEANGLSREARALCDDLLTIPMADAVDSLNVAVASAVVLYEMTYRGSHS